MDNEIQKFFFGEYKGSPHPRELSPREFQQAAARGKLHMKEPSLQLSIHGQVTLIINAPEPALGLVHVSRKNLPLLETDPILLALAVAQAVDCMVLIGQCKNGDKEIIIANSAIALQRFFEAMTLGGGPDYHVALGRTLGYQPNDIVHFLANRYHCSKYPSPQKVSQLADAEMRKATLGGYRAVDFHPYTSPPLPEHIASKIAEIHAPQATLE